MDLVLEDRNTPDKTVRIGRLEMTPAIDEDYWQFRVRLSDKQAIVGFPKFGTIGIGFAVEDDWNTNLPYSSGTTEIYEHIKHNKGDGKIKRAACIKAIEMVQEAARAFKAKQAA